MGASIATNLPWFEEQPSRRVTQQFGQTTQLACVYQGMAVNYPNWNPQRGSPHPDFPSMFLSNISESDKGGGLLEIALTYLGNLAGGKKYDDLALSIETLQQSFSWSGPASFKGFDCQLSFDATFGTVSVTFTYTTYGYQDGPLFESQASGYVQMVYQFTNITTALLAPNTNYTGIPIIPIPVAPLLMLTRFSCRQTCGVPGQKTGGTWACQETWQMAYNAGSLGFAEPNL